MLGAQSLPVYYDGARHGWFLDVTLAEARQFIEHFAEFLAEMEFVAEMETTHPGSLFGGSLFFFTQLRACRLGRR